MEKDSEEIYRLMLLLLWVSIFISITSSYLSYVYIDKLFLQDKIYGYITDPVISKTAILDIISLILAYKTLRIGETIRQQNKAPNTSYAIIMIMLNITAWILLVALFGALMATLGFTHQFIFKPI